MKTYYEVEEYVFPVETKEEAIKVAERISSMRKKLLGFQKSLMEL